MAFFFSFDPLSRPVLLDAATWDYMSIEVAKGLVPYRDIFLHKTPLAAYFGATGAWLAPAVSSLTAVNGAHLVYLALGSAAPALLYLLCRPALPVAGAVAAAAFMMAVDQWMVAALEGARPKVATVALGLGSLLCASRGSFLWSGVLGGLSTLCWQPGVSFLVGSAVHAVVEETRHGRRPLAALLRIGGGSGLPVAALLAWFYSVGALGDFFEQAVGFNLHYIKTKSMTARRTAATVWTVVKQWNRTELMLMLPALLGMVVGRRLPPTGILVAGLCYVVMTFISFQAWPDTILFAPFLGALLAVGLCALVARLPKVVLAVVLGVAVIAASTPHSARLRPPVTYEKQGKFYRKIVGPIGSGDPIVTISTPEALIHLERRSAWRWPYMWSGVDRFAARKTGGDFDSLYAELAAIDPAVIIISRRWGGRGRAAFNRWAESRYERSNHRFYPGGAPIVVYKRVSGADGGA